MADVEDRYNSHFVFAQELISLVGRGDVFIHEPGEGEGPEAEYLAAIVMKRSR